MAAARRPVSPAIQGGGGGRLNPTMVTDTDNNEGPDLDPQELERLKHKFGFSEEEIRQFQEAFSVLDLDGDGVIDLDELARVMAAFNLRPSKQELEALIKRVNRSRSGAVSFDEFIQMMSVTVNIDRDQDLKEVFNVINVSGNGGICVDELYSIMIKLGEQTNTDEVQDMIKEADLNGDGVIDLLEFKRILSK